MERITAKNLREMWLKFYESKGHKVIPSASVIPDNDPSVLFTTAGMHPLVPYLLGEKHPEGKRLTDIQKCIRTGDIDSVGDNSHLTFFEMLGNWSLGDYFKKEKVAWSYEFLTSAKYLNLKPEQFAVTVFAGNNNAPKDEETAKYWEEQGVKKDRIFYLSDNWWEINRGPCGPDSEMFLDTGKEKCCENCDPSCNCGKYIELGNDVYMQYEKISDTEYIPAKQKNVDTGFGLERNLIVLNNTKSVYTTEIFCNIIAKIEEMSDKKYNDDGDEFTKSFRVIADHIRTSAVILGDEKAVTPSNKDAGYVLRRLIRKSVRHGIKLGIKSGDLSKLVPEIVKNLGYLYPEFVKNENFIIDEINKEEERFLKTVSLGIKEFEKTILGIEKKNNYMKSQNSEYVEESQISGKAAFRLYETFGFPIEMTEEMAKEKGYTVDIDSFNKAYAEHQELARSSSEGHFKGGLAGTGGIYNCYHTATHLTLAALRKFLGNTIFQRGSNITEERMRFDFSFDRKLTIDELQMIENEVNENIKKAIPVVVEEMSLEDAKKSGAMGIFENKYGDKVTVYTIGDVSKEICGGPHAKNTSELVKYKIIKEEAVSAGVRRIKAVLEIN